jgi:hypothetical protein
MGEKIPDQMTLSIQPKLRNCQRSWFRVTLMISEDVQKFYTEEVPGIYSEREYVGGYA